MGGDRTFEDDTLFDDKRNVKVHPYRHATLLTEVSVCLSGRKHGSLDPFNESENLVTTGVNLLYLLLKMVYINIPQFNLVSHYTNHDPTREPLLLPILTYRPNSFSRTLWVSGDDC